MRNTCSVERQSCVNSSPAGATSGTHKLFFALKTERGREKEKDPG